MNDNPHPRVSWFSFSLHLLINLNELKPMLSSVHGWQPKKRAGPYNAARVSDTARNECSDCRKRVSLTGVQVRHPFLLVATRGIACMLLPVSR